ncbi:MAG: NUDIX domain-containing protein [Bacteroidia bacterium]|nr:NUDIX domain-containing protein [Bacteroidia bacterium]
MLAPKFFRIGVYGLLLQNNHLLIAKEIIKGKEIIKFPGGGLQLGEGIKDALIREFKEELEITIELLQHIYINDFYVQSAVNSDFQVIAIYYLVNTQQALPSTTFTRNNITFYWENIVQLSENVFTFETDKKAFLQLKKLIL